VDHDELNRVLPHFNTMSSAEPEFGLTGEPSTEPEPETTNASYQETSNWWPEICQTPLYPGQRPSNLEIFVPPALLTIILISGKLFLVISMSVKSFFVLLMRHDKFSILVFNLINFIVLF